METFGQLTRNSKRPFFKSNHQANPSAKMSAIEQWEFLLPINTFINLHTKTNGIEIYN